MPGDSLALSARSFPIAILTAREPVAGNRWVTERWRVLGIVAGPGATARERRQIRVGADGEQYRWDGFAIELNESDADAYYYNLVGQQPSVLVVSERAADGELRPLLATVDYIGALSHQEAGYQVDPVPIPPEIYLWVERYVLDHYTPQEQPQRRKREDRPPGDRS